VIRVAIVVAMDQQRAIGVVPDAEPCRIDIGQRLEARR
jgi:hypothetical protein